MPNWALPQTDKCCGCVTDLKSAAAIIAILGIVTSPAVSWAAVRHSYVIRVSCFITTSETRPDIVDINLNNILSFGFGANAGLGPSCLSPSNTSNPPSSTVLKLSEPVSSELVHTVKYFGWIVLLADIIFLFASINFLLWIFKGQDKRPAKIFIWSAALSITLSFIYGMMYVGACVSIGGAFPIFEFLFCIIDVILWLTWIHFIIVLYSYSNKKIGVPVVRSNKTEQINYMSYCPTSRYILDILYEMVSAISVGLLFNSSSFLQTQNGLNEKE